MINLNLQMIIGGDKHNPHFTLYRNSEEKLIYMFLGSVVIGTYSEDKNDLQYKLMIGRLYNENFKLKTLVRAFNVSEKTIKKWGSAAKAGNQGNLLKYLRTPGFPKKITAPIEKFIGLRFFQIYKTNKYSYSKEIRKEIYIVFALRISSSRLTPIFTSLRKTIKETGYPEIEDQEQISVKNMSHYDPLIYAQTEVKELKKEQNPKEKPSTNEHEKNMSQHAPSFFETKGKCGLCHYAGILIFSTMLNKLKKTEKFKLLIKQWIITILIGKMNIEQTKFVDFNSIDVLIGESVKTLSTQRKHLNSLSKETQEKQNLLRFNGEIVKIHDYSDFYYDPHTKHYTGEQNILKSWCGNLGFVDKVINMDFIHTSAGHPVYIEEGDTFLDIRERFKKILSNFRKALGIPKEKQLTFIVDRGIYKKELFQSFIGTKIHFITWEKNYKKGQWIEDKKAGEFILTKPRNNSHDLLKYEFKYIDQAWEKESKIRKLIAIAKNPNGNLVEVSILTSDRTGTAEEIISLIFKRWIQENDFKYLDKHFGINEITSYKGNPYEEIAKMSVFEKAYNEKECLSGAYKALQLNLQDQKTILKNELLKRELSNSKPKKNPLETQSQKIERLKEEIIQTEKTLSETQKQVLKLSTLIESNKYLLDSNIKMTMDIVKITARNMFYEAFQPFKEKYNNYRDDHEIFRQLTRSMGGVFSDENSVNIILFPTVNYHQNIKSSIKQILNQLNEAQPTMTDGSDRKLKFHLGKKSNKLFEILPTKMDYVLADYIEK